MIALVIYLLKVTICSGILFFYYHFALKNKLFHQWNRFYLLAAIALSILIPIVEIQLKATEAETIIYSFGAPSIIIDRMVTQTESSISPETWIIPAYVSIAAILLLSLIYSLMKLFIEIKRRSIEKIDGIKFIESKLDGTPFSFFKYIFWNASINLQTEEGQHIFKHELVHAREKHSLDKLFIQLVLVFFWCNPFYWMMRKEMKAIHEFIADKKAVGELGVSAFAAMILQASYKKHYYSLTNQFFQTSIKRRLAMITKVEKTKLNYFSRIIALPLFAFTILAFSAKVNAIVEEKSNASDLLSSPNSNISEPITDTVPKQYYKGKEIDVLSVNGKYEKVYLIFTDGSKDSILIKDAQKENLIIPPPPPPLNLRNPINPDGTRPLIIVDGKEHTGDLNKLEPSDISSVDVLKDKSATDKYGTKGQHGVIEITLKKNTNLIIKSGDPKPTIIVDGKEYAKDLNTIDPNTIESVNVLKGESATNKWGTRGKNGVIEIVLKKDLKEVIVQGYPLRNDNNKVFEKAEVPASVDKQEWRRFLEQNLQPIIEGISNKGTNPGVYTIQLRFIVQTDGSVTNIYALNEPVPGLKEAVLDMMKKSPKWKPAVQNNKPVASYYTQPITLVIADAPDREIKTNR